MRIYYLDEEYEPNKHLIVATRKDASPRLEDLPKRRISAPHTVLVIDEEYNSVLCHKLLRNRRGSPDEDMPDKYCIDNAGQIIEHDTGETVTIIPNPQKEAYKLSQLHGLTQQQLENYIDNNVTNLAEARDYIKKLSAVVLWLVKQTKLDQ